MPDGHSTNLQSSLFREEALARLRGSVWQPAMLSRPVSGYLLALFALLAGAGVATFAGTFEFARKESVPGYLTPADGWARVSAGAFGVVNHRFVAPGAEVGQGDLLLEIAPGDGLQQAQTVQERMLEENDQRRAALEGSLRLTDAEHRHEVVLLQRQNSSNRRQITRLTQEIEVARAQLHIAQQRYRDGQRLLTAGALPPADVVRLEDEAHGRSLTLSERQRSLERLREALAINEARLQRLPLNRDLKQANLRERLHALAMDALRLQSEGATRLLAPRSGVVASVRVDVGDGVQPGQPLLDIVPGDGQLQARLFAPPAAMGFVRAGQEVRVYLDAFPYERHGAQTGRVLSVSETAVSPAETAVGPMTAGFAYRIDVAFPEGFTLPPAQQLSLRPGMTVTADLVRDYGTLVDWALEPLRGAATRL